MKKAKKNILIVLLLLFSVGFTSYAQTANGYRLPASEKAIPKLVLNAFYLQYHNVLVSNWYVTHISYWQNDYSSGWYNNWYGERTIVLYSYDKPTYFEVEFRKSPGELSRAIYNLHGYWYETRSQIKGLPLAILEVLQQPVYKGWKVSPLKERIESSAWPVDIYRFNITKGLKSRIIRMDEKGNIIQSRDIID